MKRVRDKRSVSFIRVRKSMVAAMLLFALLLGGAEPIPSFSSQKKENAGVSRQETKKAEKEWKQAKEVSYQELPD